MVESAASDVDALLYIYIHLLFCCRWPKCDSAYHKMFVKEIKDSGEVFREASSFIPALLSLETSHLLSDKNVDEKEIADLMELRRDLGQFLTAFIQKRKLAGVHTARCFKDSVVCINCAKKQLTYMHKLHICCPMVSCMGVMHPLQGERNTFTPLQQVVLSTLAKVRMCTCIYVVPCRNQVMIICTFMYYCMSCMLWSHHCIVLYTASFQL